ncbi:hypothetical protein D9757_002927 [Collybiopsis confluens]|uniref:Minichromosome loss protein Mcl1 middle region domain-containing protein n=1 Tax=Collybiopsis confluens TaxID=2823264 RepID=A0A8H5HVF1_9AGAR|nr:hypothetical protein D9757_002927 [Collybiopsis confluens]
MAPSGTDIIPLKGHIQGYTCISFSVDGKHVFTGGSDCTVRIWTVEKESEPEIANDADDAITSIATSDDYWLSSCEDSRVRRYVKDRDQFHDDVTECASLPVRCIALDSQGKRLAVASDNPVAKIINMENTLEVMLLNGHKHNVRRASWHPKSPILATCASDGTVIVWNLSKEEPVIIQTLDSLIPSVAEPSSPEFLHDCSVIWHPSGSHFYVISKTHDVICISTKTWIQTGKFTDRRISQVPTALAVSPNGLYLATACGTSIFVWSTDKREILASKTPSYRGGTITQLSFSPTDNILAWTDTLGQFFRWLDAIPKDLPGPVQTIRDSSKSSESEPFLKDDLFAESAAPDILLGGDLHHLEDDNNDVPGDEGDTVADIDDGFVIDDIGGYMDEDDTLMKGGKNRDDGELVREMVSITKAQPAFQPGSTPFLGNKRYLAYNMLGIIETTQSEKEDHNLVSVEFFDTSARRSLRFNDTHKCHLAYLGERGVLFASDTMVLYKPYGSWTSVHDWTYLVTRPGAKVVGTAAGGMTPSRSSKNYDSDGDITGFGNVVVATSQGHLIFLSGTGRPRQLIALGGEFVTMVAGDEWVMVVYRAGATTIDGSQSLHYKIYNFEDFSVRQRDELPIPKGHTLKWIGITQEGAPAIYDSSGMVYLVAKYRVPHHATWTCVLDTNLLERRAGKDESYWPVGITGNTFMCLILKGRQEHPGFPRPLVQELPLRIPFDTTNEKEEQIERELLFKEMLLERLDDEELTTEDILSQERVIDKEFVSLIQVACKDDNTPRAIELTKLLHNVQTFDIVAKIADFYHLAGFKEKVELLKRIREESEDRFEAAREKRRRWNKIDSRPQRIPDVDTDVTRSGPAPKVRSFQDFGPPPAIFRPGLSRAMPVIESTRYSSNVASAQSEPSPGSDDMWSDPLAPSALSEKRKRSNFEDVEMESQSNLSILIPPKQKSNPFARKSGLDTNKNPFARKSGDKTILKSESFFEKVEKVEAAEKVPTKLTKRKGKDKDKSDSKEGSRQQTLFGMFGANQDGDSLKNKGPGKKSSAEESQRSDVVMGDASQIEANSDLEETQLLEDVL